MFVCDRQLVLPVLVTNSSVTCTRMFPLFIFFVELVLIVLAAFWLVIVSQNFDSHAYVVVVVVVMMLVFSVFRIRIVPNVPPSSVNFFKKKSMS